MYAHISIINNTTTTLAPRAPLNYDHSQEREIQ